MTTDHPSAAAIQREPSSWGIYVFVQPALGSLPAAIIVRSGRIGNTVPLAEYEAHGATWPADILNDVQLVVLKALYTQIVITSGLQLALGPEE